MKKQARRIFKINRHWLQQHWFWDLPNFWLMAKIVQPDELFKIS